MSTEEMTRKSMVLYAERATLRDHLARGGSLSLILADLPLGSHPLGGMEVLALLRWLPGVGEVRARRMATGLPERYTIRMLTQEQRNALTATVRSYERGRALRLVTPDTESH
jgi:hypothetical protein